MKQLLCLLLIMSILGCSSGPRPQGQGRAASRSGGTTVGDADISARGAIGGVGIEDGPRFEGNGGSDIRLAILAPETQGEVPDYLPLYVQGLLNNNFGRYSAITLIDRQNLEQITAEQNIAAGGQYSDEDFVAIGNLTNTQYFLFGTIQRLSGGRYSLQLSVTDSGTGVRRASFVGDGTSAQLEGSGTLINSATADLLDQMGVQLTSTGRQALLAGNTTAARAEAGLARGITAQAGGAEVAALLQFSQSVAFDPSQMEAMSRLTSLSSTISEGSLTERIQNDIQARNEWLDTFQETAAFFNEHPPYEIIFDPNLIQIGDTNYAKGTADLGMRIALNSTAGFGALDTLLEGLERTNRRNVWGFDGWPLLDINPKTRGTVVFEGKRSFSYKVDVMLLNEEGKALGKSAIALNTGVMAFRTGDKTVRPPSGDFQTVRFTNIKAADLTPVLTIVITAVNGIPSHELSASGYMRIDAGDLVGRARAVAAEQTQMERATAAQRAQAERERTSRAQVNKEKIKQVGLYVLAGTVVVGVVAGAGIWLYMNQPKDRTVY